MKGALIGLLLGLAALRLSPSAAAQSNVTFRAIDIYLDSGGTPLAAYQLEFGATNGSVKIVGIEGGESPAFADPPFYDPKAMQRERVIIAAFSTKEPAQLPAGRSRVATIHVQTVGPDTPRFELRVQTAANSSGAPIHLNATFEERKTQ